MLMLQKQDERQRNMREKTRRLHIGFSMIFHLFVVKHSRKFHVHIFLVHIDSTHRSLHYFVFSFIFNFVAFELPVPTIQTYRQHKTTTKSADNKNGKPELKIKK